jgi:hypothetical protein
MFNDDWLPLDKNRVTKFLNNGKVLVIRPKDKEAVVPLFCPLCKFPLKTSEDVMSFRECGGCYPCDLRWIKPKRETKGELWEEYLVEREQRSKPNITFE